MRCKKHYTDLSSIIGVCACCLRERLLSLIAVEEQTLAHLHNLDGRQRNPAAASCRKSDYSTAAAAPSHHHSLSDQQFYTTPAGDHSSNKKRSFIRFFSFQNIFRSRNRNSVDSVSDLNNVTSSSSSSWFSSIIHCGRHRRKPTICLDKSTMTGIVRDRGMSPVRNSDLGNGDEDELHNAISGCESVEKNTPRRTPAHSNLRRGGGGGGHVRNLSFCLSPLVRASPNRQWNLPDVEIRGQVKPPHISNTKSFCANRSRKLADFGRPNPNR